MKISYVSYLVAGVAALVACLALAYLLLRPQVANAKTPKVGEKAPDFTLPDQNRRPVKLSDFRGKRNVVLAFYVKAATPG